MKRLSKRNLVSWVAFTIGYLTTTMKNMTSEILSFSIGYAKPVSGQNYAVFLQGMHL